MKALSLLIIVLLSVSVMAENTSRILSIYTFTKSMSPAHSKLIPQRLRSIEVQDLKISESHITFKLKNFPLHIELVQSKDVAMKVNGVAFSPEDFKSTKILKRQIAKKFSLQPKKFSLMDLFLPKAHAVFIQGNLPLGIAQNLMNAGYPVQYGNYQQTRTYPDMASLISAVNAAGAEGPNLMAAIMGAANNFEYKGYQAPPIEPFRLKSSKSAN